MITPDISPEWARQIEAAQRVTHESIDGERYARRPHNHDAQAPCTDCMAGPGQLHVPDCAVERCPACGGQAISCNCPVDAP